MYKAIAEINAFLESIDKSGLIRGGREFQKGGEAKFLEHWLTIIWFPLLVMFL